MKNTQLKIINLACNEELSIFYFELSIGVFSFLCELQHQKFL